MDRSWRLPFTKVCMFSIISAVLISVSSSDKAFGSGAGTQAPSEEDWQYRARDIKKLRDSYPDADAVVLRQSITIEMDENGLATRSFMRRVALFTDNAIRRYGDPRILYDAGTQELDVTVACVYMRDGNRVDSQENAFNQTTPFAFSQAPDYTNWQEMVVTHIGIEKECVAELHYTIRDKERTRRWLSGVQHLACNDPVLVSEFTIAAPPGVQLKHSSSHGAPDPETLSGGEYKWRLERVPAVPPVDGGVWWGDFAPTVIYSTAKSWSEVARHIRDMFAASTVSSADPGDDEESEPTEEKIFEIHKEALDCVRGVEAPFDLLDPAPRKSDRIYQSAYAHPLDRAVLLKAKLGEMGIESVPVLVSAGRTWPDDVPAPEIFNRVYLEVHAHDTDEALWLDPENRFLRDPKMMIAGMTAVRCIGGGEIIRVPQATPASNQSSLELTLSLDDEGKLMGEGSASMRGIFSPYYSVKGLKNETEEFTKNKVEGMFPAASLKSSNIKTLDKGCVEIGFSFEAELPQATAQERLYLTLPEPFMADLSGTDRVHVERSEYPVPLRVVPCDLRVSVTFESLPDWELLGNPLHADEKNAVGHVKRATERESSGSEPKLRLTRSLVIEKEIVTGETYPDLRSLLLKYGESQIILTKRGD